MSGREHFEQFLNYGWKPNWHCHPEYAPLELVLIEPRPHRNLRCVLENMSCVLPHASMTIFHSEQNAKLVHDIVQAESENNVRLLDVLPDNLTQDEYNRLMTSRELWSHFSGEKVLIFQLDSGIRYNNVLRFMQYDYIGAPWNWMIANDPRITVGNGGFSMRSPNWMMDVATSFSYSQQIDTAEDIFFARYLMNCDEAVLPSKSTAARFSVEHVPFEDPMAFHKAYDFHESALVERWMTTNLAPHEMETIVVIQDAWIECENGRLVHSDGNSSDHTLRDWLKMGISTDGLMFDEHTKLSCIKTDPCPGLRKHLGILYTKDGDSFRAKIPLHKMTIADVVQL